MNGCSSAGDRSRQLHTGDFLGDAAAIEARLAERPDLATARRSARVGTAALRLLCPLARALTRGKKAWSRSRRLIALSRPEPALLAAPRRAPAAPWGAVSVVRSLHLAAAVLDAGADPSDGARCSPPAQVMWPRSTSLFGHGADVNRPWPPTGDAAYAILHWATTPDGVRWLLITADPDPVLRRTANTAARRRELGRLARRGVSESRREYRAARADGRTPYAVAELSGNGDVAAWLLAHGAPGELSDVDRFVSACSRGERAAALVMLDAHPDLRRAIGGQHYAAFYRAAERNDTKALDAMLACGFDPDRPDESIGKTALHAAAMEGWPETVRVLLAHGASVDVRDREFKAQPLIWAAEG